MSSFISEHGIPTLLQFIYGGSNEKEEHGDVGKSCDSEFVEETESLCKFLEE